MIERWGLRCVILIVVSVIFTSFLRIIPRNHWHCSICHRALSFPASCFLFQINALTFVSTGVTKLSVTILLLTFWRTNSKTSIFFATSFKSSCGIDFLQSIFHFSWICFHGLTNRTSTSPSRLWVSFVLVWLRCELRTKLASWSAVYPSKELLDRHIWQHRYPHHALMLCQKPIF